METQLTSFAFTDKTSACFIERNQKIRSSARLVMEKWLKWISTRNEQRPLKYKEYVKIEITNALEHEEQVWQAINNSNHIWCQSYLSGESGTFFLKMLRRAKASGLQNKVFFDLAMRSDTMRDMPIDKPEIDQLVAELEEQFNNKFLFWHEIIGFMA